MSEQIYIVGEYEYCRKCNCPRFDHNEDPVDDCPKKRVYEWRGIHIVASSEDHASQLLNDELGVRFGASAYKPRRAKGPFRVCDWDMNQDHEVSEERYAATVATYAGGIVKEL